jgi:hypothetical protein
MVRRDQSAALQSMRHATGIMAGGTISAILGFTVDATTAAVSARAGRGRRSGRCGIAGSPRQPRIIQRSPCTPTTIAIKRRIVTAIILGIGPFYIQVPCPRRNYIAGENSPAIIAVTASNGTRNMGGFRTVLLPWANIFRNGLIQAISPDIRPCACAAPSNSPSVAGGRGFPFRSTRFANWAPILTRSANSRHGNV